MVTLFVKRRQQAGRVGRHYSSEIFLIKLMCRQFSTTGRQHDGMSILVSLPSALRGRRSAMSHNAFASTGESL